MDQIKVESMFIKALIGRSIKKALYKKLGCDVEIGINDFDVVIDDKKATVKLNINSTMPREHFARIVDALVK